jgi:hypothetical protein
MQGIVLIWAVEIDVGKSNFEHPKLLNASHEDGNSSKLEFGS